MSSCVRLRLNSPNSGQFSVSQLSSIFYTFLDVLCHPECSKKFSPKMFFHPNFFWMKQGATQCYQAFLVYLGVNNEIEVAFFVHITNSYVLVVTKFETMERFPGILNTLWMIKGGIFFYPYDIFQLLFFFQPAQSFTFPRVVRV